MSCDDYSELVRRRKICHACDGLINPSDVDDGAYDSHHIGPWSRWQGHLSAELMIVGQDWGGVKYFRDNRGWDDARNPTCQVLVRLIESVGIKIGLPNPSAQSRVFLTNAILCLKKGALQDPVDKQWFTNCAPFLRRQVEIVRPKVLVTLGARATFAAQDAFGLPRKSLSQAVSDQKGDFICGTTRLIAVYHCGKKTLNINRSFELQLKDWKRVQRVLD